MSLSLSLILKAVRGGHCLVKDYSLPISQNCQFQLVFLICSIQLLTVQFSSATMYLAQSYFKLSFDKKKRTCCS